MGGEIEIEKQRRDAGEGEQMKERLRSDFFELEQLEVERQGQASDTESKLDNRGELKDEKQGGGS